MSFLVEVDMRSESAKTLLHVVCLAFVICISAGAQCPVQAVLIKGRVENATVDSKVRVQLLYPKGKRGESAKSRWSMERFRFQSNL